MFNVSQVFIYYFNLFLQHFCISVISHDPHTVQCSVRVFEQGPDEGGAELYRTQQSPLF